MKKAKPEGERAKSVSDKRPVEYSQRWTISHKELETWLDGIAAARTLLAPRDVSGVTLYRPVANSAEIAPVFTRPLLSVKGVFFPPTERMFTIHKTGLEVQLEETFPEWETVVFGVRPCDARGARLLDAIFLNTNPVDAFYARRRENTTLIGLACKELGPTCFCTSVGGSPDDASGVDIMLYETEGGYLAQAVTEKGRYLIPGGEWKETDLAHQPSAAGSQYHVPEKDEWPGRFKDDYCAYVCPTCRCFVVRDEVLAPGEFERLRCWDSCMGENYRRVAGGHKPRFKRGERQRNRFFCKFYYFPEQYGLGAASACTGCGRCIEVCPVGVDVTEVLVDMEEQV
ncbi:MAG: 4Fe-4S dicluster domain-containing protein [Chloroflexi bacterium]|nr:4Fe-4S dicluster domain-containing protein [Chloroflexota bacterium]